MRRHVKASSAGSSFGKGNHPGQIIRGAFAMPRAHSDANGSGAPSAGACLLVVFALALTSLALSASSALAASIHVLTAPAIAEAGSSPGQLSLEVRSGLAINQTSGDVYIADTGNKRVSQFQSDGTFIRSFGNLGTPTFLAIDQANGDLYVVNSNNETISKFKADGTPITGWAESGKLTGEAVSGRSFEEIAGIAVDPAGNLLVHGSANPNGASTMFKFSNAGVFAAEIETPFLASGAGLAVDSTGAIYKARGYGAPAKFGPAGTSELFNEEVDPGPATGLAVDPSNDDFYVADGNHIARYDSSSTPIETSIGSLDALNTAGLAVRASNHEILVADVRASQILRYTIQNVEPPAVTIDSVSSPSAPTPHVTGTVNPEGHIAICRFEYVADEQFQGSGFSGASSAPCATSPGSGMTTVSVEADLIGLIGGTEYHVRLAATNAAGISLSAEPNPSFETEVVTPPSVQILAPTNVTGTSVHLNGEVNPNAPGAAPQDPAYDIKWHFACSPSCSGPSGTFKGDNSAHAVGDDVNLEPNTHYTVTLIAENRGGKVEKTTSFDTPAVAPGVVTSFNTPEAGGRVRLMGYVNPRGSEVDECRFEYGPTASYGSMAPCTPAHPGNELQQLYISATEGQFRLRFASETTSDLPFDAAAAQVQSALEGLSAIGAGNVSVNGGPGDADATKPYEIAFEGSLARQDMEELFVEAGTTPPGGGSASFPTRIETINQGSPNQPTTAFTHIVGLDPDVAYHYRLVTTNAAGTGASPDATFTTVADPAEGSCSNIDALGADQLDECRAWEMVSPPNKNGGDVIGSGSTTQIADDGSAASFASLAPFGDTNGSGVDSAYLSLRTPAGWVTHGTKPPQAPASFIGLGGYGLFSHYVLDFSADLNQGIFLAWRPLDDSEPNVDNTLHVYVRKDMRTAGEGSYELASPCPLCAEAQPPEPLPESAFRKRPWTVTTTPDFSHVLFESELNLTAGAEGGALKLYEYTGGALRLVGILPDGTPAPRSVAGSGGSASPAIQQPHHAMSADGSKIFFSADGGYFGGSGNLFMRVNGAETIQLNVPEAGIGPLSGVTYGDATPDGSKVFFISENKIYMYDTTKPASDSHNLTLLSDGATIILGASADGSTVYFTAGTRGQSEPGAPLTDLVMGVYAWHEGKVRFLSQLPDAGTRVRLESSRVSADGQLLFPTDYAAQPTGYHQEPGSCGSNAFLIGCIEYYLYDPHSEAMQCVSCSPDGDAPTQAAHEEPNVSLGGASHGRRVARLLSEDGRYAFFETAQALVPNDSNGVGDPYVFDSATGTVHLLSSGTDPTPSYYLDSNPDGSDALILTREQISARDVDQGLDLYDARIDGGLPEPAPVPAPCEGETCRPAPGPPPPSRSSSSARFSGPGDPAPTRRKKHRKPRKHRYHSKAKKHQSKAKHERGANR